MPLLGSMLGWAPNTPPQSCTVLPTPYSTAQIVVRVSYGGVLCAHHLLQLGPPWGTGAMPPHPRNNRTLLDDLGGPHTLHQDHIWRCRHRIRPFELRGSNRVSRTVVCTPSSAPRPRAAMGHLGQCLQTQGRAGKLLGHLGGPRIPRHEMQ